MAINIKNIKNKKISSPVGMRTIKTALVVFICLTIYHFLESLNITTRFDASLACIAAIICLQDSMEKTLSNGLYRFFGTFIGALIGMLFLYLDAFFNNPYLVIAMISLGIIVLIVTCNALKVTNGIVIGCVVFLIIALGQTTEAPYIHSIRRLADTLVGIGISIGINHFVHNPDVHVKKEEDDGDDS
ncbi:MAG: aromatic acid exporter family protein [Clostridiales Family XIII bacterium]|jgi:uncharacterized membrane protein YgaE (UPF0421/DUF939 family)|nr:aromatic acid exporter family protein [Clostridiales Family XIII bacterium]